MDKHAYQGIIQSLHSSSTIDDLHEICSRFCEINGFDYFHYGTRIPTSFTKPHFIHISGYPNEWWARYNENHYLKEDPAVAYCSNNFVPLTWDKVTPKHNKQNGKPNVMLAATEHGLASGISFPAHTPQGDFAMFSLASSQPHKQIIKPLEQVAPMGHTYTFYLHEAVRRIFATDPLPLRPITLTRREKETLLWTAEGKTTWEVSQILKISERTITFHVQNATQKLNVCNRQQAIARAVSLGLIKPQF